MKARRQGKFCWLLNVPKIGVNLKRIEGSQAAAKKNVLPKSVMWIAKHQVKNIYFHTWRYPKMDGLRGKILPKWMIQGYFLPSGNPHVYLLALPVHRPTPNSQHLHQPGLSPFNLLLLYSMIYQKSWLTADGSETLTTDHGLSIGHAGHLKQWTKVKTTNFE